MHLRIVLTGQAQGSVYGTVYGPHRLWLSLLPGPPFLLTYDQKPRPRRSYSYGGLGQNATEEKELKEVAYVMWKLRGLILVRVFVSFDYDHDEDLKTLLIGQTKNEDSPFIVTGWSLEEASSDWEEEARARIMRADQVIVLCGKHTDAAIGVNAEIAIARNENKPYFLLAGRAIGGNEKPTAALAADQLYNWTWDNLKKLIGGAR